MGVIKVLLFFIALPSIITVVMMGFLLVAGIFGLIISIFSSDS